MSAPRERVVPWLRALRSAVQAAAPNDDFVPLAAACAHLDALSPDLSGDVLAPYEIDPTSGLPSFGWMTRAMAEQGLARSARPVSAAVAARDPELAARMAARSRLATHLATHELLGVLQIDARVRRVGRETSAVLVFDHIDPIGRWVRTRLDIAARGGQRDLGLVLVDSASRITVRDGVRDLFARHVATPILLFRAALADVIDGRITRLSRACIGPFWFPGGPTPADAPASVDNALVVHFVQEIVGDDVSRTSVDDPIDRSPLSPPRGVNAFRQRRLAVFRPAVPAIRHWLGASVVIHPFG